MLGETREAMAECAEIPRRILALSREVSAILAQHAAAPVARYPGHTVAEVAWHLWSVQDWAARIVNSRSPERLERRTARPHPLDASFSATFDAGTDAMVGALSSVDPSERVWTFRGDHIAEFWFWRMLHEASIHHWDVTSAIEEEPRPIPHEIACTGLEEGLRIHGEIPLRGTAVSNNTARVALKCSDGPQGWSISLRADGIRVRSGLWADDVAGDGAVVSGTASDLWLWTTGRLATSAIHVDGDPEPVRDLHAALSSLPEAL